MTPAWTSCFRHVRPRSAAYTASAATLLFAATGLQAATVVMIWPIDPVLDTDQRATALWLENRDTKPVTLQTRIVGWSQQDHVDVYAEDQARIASSPPMVTVQPGARQLIRLIRLSDTAARTEDAYRILIDEIPQPDRSVADVEPQLAMGVKFQMHYSLPLFAYGPGLWKKPNPDSRQSAASVGKPALSWTIEPDAGKQWLVLTNRGPVHARLTHIAYLVAGKRIEQNLLGYVLSGARMRWELPDEAGSASNLRLLATVDGNADTAIDTYVKP